MNFSRFLVVGSIALLLGGCGAGSPLVKTVTRPVDPGPIPRSTEVPTAPYAPNYSANLGESGSWTRSELTVYIAPSTPAIVNAVKQGAALWSDAPGSSFTFRYVEDPSRADIKVSFVPQSALPSGAAGNTTIYYTFPGREMTSATVEIRQDVDGDNLVALTSHEFGHALGINGHSPNASDTMHAVTPVPGRITQPDNNTLALLYASRSRSRAAGPQTVHSHSIACH